MIVPQFLPRRHSEKYGWLDRSNWKDLKKPRNIGRVDPALLEIIELLNAKGYTTYSSCSGGHRTDQRRRRQRHMDGYIAFTPPTRVCTQLYFALLGRVPHFQFSAQTGILEEDLRVDQTLFSEVRWQLIDTKRHKRQYYNSLFKEMKDAVQHLPHADQRENALFLRHFLGEANLQHGRRVLNEQSARFH